MKKLEFETSKGRFLVVDIPINFLFKIHHNHLVVDSTSNGLIGKMNRLNNDPKGFIEVGRLIAKLSEITEEEVSGIVDEFKRGYKNYSYKGHKLGGQQVSMVIRDYFNKPTDSLYSLLESKGIHLYENPYKNHQDKDLETWHEELTFYNPYIFKL